MVVRGGDVGREWTKRVERSLFAQLLFQADVLDDLVHRDVAGALNHHLHAMGFGDLGQLGHAHVLERPELHDRGLAAALRRIGELSPEVELLRARIGRPGPLGRSTRCQ